MHQKSFYSARLILGTLVGLLAATQGSVALGALRWSESVLLQQPQWYGSAEALALADSVIQYQSPQGGWPKSTNLAVSPRTPDDIPPPGRGRANSLDNDATTLPMEFLARVIHATGEERYCAAFARGLDYLFAAQYPNGGWPQFWPLRKGYYSRITYNDGAMIRVMTLLRDVAVGDAPYAFVDVKQRARAKTAIEKGLDCILRTQIRQNGKLTVWCAQHDEVTLAPVSARSYELASLSGSESAGILIYLMSLEKPSSEVIRSVRAGVAWFESTRIEGFRYKKSSSEPNLIKDPSARPIWARFYELESNRTFFCDRDGEKKYDIEQIGGERRKGYSWYTNAGEKVAKAYAKWSYKGDLADHCYRVVVSTDIGGTDPDDFQSMVHLLVYADCFDIEGLISSPYGPGRKKHILEVIDCYEKDYANLKSYSDKYPTPDALRAITKQGETERAPYAGVRRSTEGSQWIIECAKRDDLRPLYVLIWGGIEDLSQALHDAPDILPKLRVYWIGGPNKKWGPDTFQYLVTHHPGLWIIESNATYRGWFTGGNQSGQWGNKAFVSQHIAGKGALGDLFVSKKDDIKMGDTPSVGWLLKGTPDDPSKPGWGGSFVRAWERPHSRFEQMTTKADRMEVFGVLELVLRMGNDIPKQPEALLAVENQKLPGHAPGDGTMRFRFCPKLARAHSFRIQSNVPALNGKTGGITVHIPSPSMANRPASDLPNWWTDDLSLDVAEGSHSGAKTVNRWRKDFLGDFAQRMLRCQSPTSTRTTAFAQDLSSNIEEGAQKSSETNKRLRVIMSSDFPPIGVVKGGDDVPNTMKSDPDDMQSMVRFLLYANEFDVEGLIASAGTFAMQARKKNILGVLDRYKKVYENLKFHDPDYPTPDYLRSVTFEGLGNNHGIPIKWGHNKQPVSEILGEGMDSEASDAIIAAADKPDPRPLWIGVWGGPREIAQAIWKVKNTRSEEELKTFISKLRVFLIAYQDATHGWLMEEFPDLFIIDSRKTYQGMFGGRDPISNFAWVNENIRHNHGPLCDVYPHEGMGCTGVCEGDSPTFLYLVSVNRGINNPEDPTQASWGGQYKRKPNTNHYVDGPGGSSISKWRKDYQKEFAERADWCVETPSAKLKPRVVVLTDISTWETDDHESLIRLLVHADMFEIEGLIISTGYSIKTLTKSPEKDFINIAHDVVNAYEKDLPNLMKRSKQVGHEFDDARQGIGYWPSPKYLRDRTMFGSLNRGKQFIGDDNDSAGSDLIIKLADEDDPRPVWVTVWGGGNTIAQSIYRVKKDRTEEQFKAFLRKIRVYAITDQDRTYTGKEPISYSSHGWMREKSGSDLLFIWDESAWKAHNGTGKSNWNHYATHIQGHGHLGSQYPKYKYGVEGDTPSFLYLMPTGLNDPENPTQCSWGGTFKGNTKNLWQPGSSCRSYFDSFYPAAFNNFAARMDWAKDGAGNRNPVIIIDSNDSISVLTKIPKQGTTVTLDASKTIDPDGDNLKFKWWIQTDAGTYSGDINISNSSSSIATVNIPSDSTGKSFHVICEVIDDDTHSLSDYRRIIFKPTN